MPFAGAEGYHSKTLAYSMWHIFRIEDIVANTLINADEQVLFCGGWQDKTGSPIGCRTAYNTCSDACRYPGKMCPNTSCCMEKGIDGCYECDELKDCKKGFYEYDDVNAVKAMALFIHKYGKKELLKSMDRLHKEHDFEKIQEVLGNDLEEGFRILENTRKR